MDKIKAFFSKPSGKASIAGFLLTSLIGSYDYYGYMNPINWLLQEPSNNLVAIVGGGIFYCCAEAVLSMRGK